MFEDSYTAEEWQTLRFAPLWVFTAVAGMDSNIEVEEVAALAKEVAEAPLFKEPLVKEVLMSVGASFGDVLPAYHADSRDVLRGLKDVADILERRATPEQARAFKSSMLLIGRNVAESSGGGRIFHREKVSEKETAALVAAATAMRATM
jgi:hypothetical protein